MYSSMRMALPYVLKAGSGRSFPIALVARGKLLGTCCLTCAGGSGLRLVIPRAAFDMSGCHAQARNALNQPFTWPAIWLVRCYQHSRRHTCACNDVRLPRMRASTRCVQVYGLPFGMTRIMGCWWRPHRDRVARCCKALLLRCTPKKGQRAAEEGARDANGV